MEGMRAINLSKNANWIKMHSYRSVKRTSLFDKTVYDSFTQITIACIQNFSCTTEDRINAKRNILLKLWKVDRWLLSVV